MRKKQDGQYTLIYTTKSGTLYNLTPFNQKELNTGSLQLVMGDFYQMLDTIKALPPNISFREFIKAGEKKLFLGPTEFGTARTRGCTKEDEVQLECFGWRDFSVGDYLDMVDILSPEVLICLTEEQRNEGGKKSMKRAVAKTKSFLDQTLAHFKDSKQKIEIYAQFLGDFFEEQREECLTHILTHQKSLSGIFISGLYFRERDSLFSERKKIYQQLEKVDPSLKRFLSSRGDPGSILEGAFFGITQFECFFPFEMAKKYSALTFSPQAWLESIRHLASMSYPVFSDHVQTAFSKNDPREKKLPLINLQEEPFAKDMRSLVEGCKCYSCKTITRAYIHHLIKHHEMTANVLLVIHNCWVYDRFMEVVNSQEFADEKERAIYSFFELYL